MADCFFKEDTHLKILNGIFEDTFLNPILLKDLLFVRTTFYRALVAFFGDILTVQRTHLFPLDSKTGEFKRIPDSFQFAHPFVILALFGPFAFRKRFKVFFLPFL